MGAGMLPLAVGAGPGAEERKAIAIVVIGGQKLSLVLTLWITPVFLLGVLKWHARKRPGAVREGAAGSLDSAPATIEPA